MLSSWGHHKVAKATLVLCLIAGIPASVGLLRLVEEPSEEKLHELNVVQKVAGPHAEEKGHQPLEGCERQAHRSPLESDCIATDSQTGVEVMPWAEAKPLTWPWVEPDTAVLDEFQAQTLSVALEVPGLEEPLSISLDPWSSQDLLELLRSEGVSVVEPGGSQLRDLDDLRRELMPRLQPLSETARSLLAEAYFEYWRLDMFQRAPMGDDPRQPPPAPHPQPRGAYVSSFGGQGGGWRIWVQFDSADFPELEWTLSEIAQLKRSFAERVLSKLGLKE